LDTLVADPTDDPKVRPKPPTPAEALAAQYLATVYGDEEHIELQDRKDSSNGSSSSGSLSNNVLNEKALVVRRLQRTVTAPLNPLGRWCSSRSTAMRRRSQWLALSISSSKPLFYGRCIARSVGSFLGVYGKKKQRLLTMPEAVFDRGQMLQRMNEMRRLVTGMTRLLGFKHQVVRRLKRRAGHEGGEVGAYIGDIHGEWSLPLR
jgi:Mg2+ and Co2+ transporter CorA